MTSAAMDTAAPTAWTGHDWHRWSTRCRLVTAADHLKAATAIAQEVLDDVERACSRFRPDSELLTLRPGADGWATVSPMLVDLLEEALRAQTVSEGALDPTVGGALAALGYNRDIAEVRRSPATIRVVRRAAARIELRGNQVRIPAGVLVDLGATAKAVAADRCAARIATALDTSVLVSLGGDIATAGPGPAGGWQVTVQDLPDDEATQVALSSGAAIATSSTARRAWTGVGDDARPLQLHHIIDPRTGRPAEGPWRAATVVASSCALANTASTAALVKGAQAAGWLGALGLPARLLGYDGRQLLVNGWPS